MKLSNIQAELNQKGYIYRSEFMRDYSFDGNYFTYLSGYITDNIKTNNCMFLTDLIYFATKINFNTIKFKNILKKILVSDNRNLVKLAILDYFVELEPQCLPKDYEKTLLDLLKKSNYNIVKNQIYFNLFLLNNSSINFYFERLTECLKNTNDWKSIYRVLLNFKYVSSSQFINYKTKVVELIKKLHLEKKFGEGVDEILLSLKKE